MNIFFIVTAIILLVCYYNENKVVEYFSPCVVTRRQYQGRMTAEQCQNRCENRKYGKDRRRWWRRTWPCKYAVTEKGIHNTGKRGKCWHTTGKDQLTMNKNCDRQYDVWENKNYKKPEIWKWKTIRLGNMGTVWHPKKPRRKYGYIFPDKKERKVRQFRWVAKGKDQGWGNRTRSSKGLLYDNRWRHSGWVGNEVLPRVTEPWLRWVGRRPRRKWDRRRRRYVYRGGDWNAKPVLGNRRLKKKDRVLKECQGDCDNDRQCKGRLRCFQRNGYRKVPGCRGRGVKGGDYCYDPYKKRGGGWQSKTKNFSRPYPKFNRYYGMSTSVGKGHRNITSNLRLRVNYLED